jgi:DNA polymerase-1
MLILGIDFNNMIYGSYYGNPLYNKQGKNVNAIRGFFTKFQLIFDNLDPDYVVFANDLSRTNTFRRKLYENYKAQRKPTDDDVIFQVQQTSILVKALGFKFLNDPLYEADDILGMVSKWCVDNNHDMVIISSDRDLYQLINEHVQIYSFIKHEMINSEYMEEHYKLTPSQWIELKMIQGDPSDNIPGIKGIGKVTAQELMDQYGNINNIYANINNLKNGIRDKLIAGSDTLPLMRELVTIVTDYNKINFDLNLLKRSKPDQETISNVLYYLQIPSLIPVLNNLAKSYERSL